MTRTATSTAPRDARWAVVGCADLGVDLPMGGIPSYAVTSTQVPFGGPAPAPGEP